MKKYYKKLQKQILIVDDLPENVRLLSSLLSEQGYGVSSATDGKMALAIVKQKCPDLILLDIMIPQIDGYQICRYLKSEVETKHIPIIFLSGLDSELDKIEAFKVGGVDYITKPFFVEEVVFRVKAQLASIHQQQKFQHMLEEQIAERKIAEQELHKSRALLTGVLDSSLDGVAAFEAIRDRQGEIVDFRWLIANPVAAMTVGGKIENLKGKRLFVENSPGHLFYGLFELFVQVVETCAVLEQEYYYNSSSLKTWFQIVAVKLGDGLAITFRDISDRKQIETTLKNANQRLTYEANIDSLTQIANRRRFDEYIAQEWSRCDREQKYLSLLLCDVDYFKAYNDTYGHQAGDSCLYEVAKGIERAVRRPADLAFRYGGEEFAVILPHTDGEGAIKVAEEIQKQIQDLNLAHAASKIDEIITLSVGVSSIIPNAQASPRNLISAADSALYDAKVKGRNRIIYRSVELG
ncbi:diguanylate cyclase response regulator [Pleurocapsa sp. CCALA 161]|uniref:diguanylate cyclase domain-containing protein n=1 Tax=Pleurocapsa sp. CCALA 161 TaxID=2107688 RepID=UPI000D058855|nr:diguanylate cyclase [Pleurocapsa sp. CCALA 161]PSB10377.1 diguanylate cyclase response regulator [Pleurocapsa sp. CCALA 161]